MNDTAQTPDPELAVASRVVLLHGTSAGVMTFLVAAMASHVAEAPVRHEAVGSLLLILQTGAVMSSWLLGRAGWTVLYRRREHARFGLTVTTAAGLIMLANAAMAFAAMVH